MVMRNLIKIIENAQPHMIEVSDDSYSLEGYVTETGEEQIDNWLSYRHHIDDPTIVEMIRERFSKIAFLNHISVEEDARGKGMGNQLLSEFLTDAYDFGAEAVFLVADTAENQQHGFDLLTWYEDWGFSVIHETGGGPLMMKAL